MWILKVAVMYRFCQEPFSDTVPLHTDLLDEELSSSVFLYQLKYRTGWGSLGIPVARSRGL